MEKFQHVRSFISAASDYAKHPSETTSAVIQKHLGVISASLDLSIFDPGSSISAEFYVSLHELMNALGSRTTLIWSAVDVLQTACRNAAARQALIHTYKFAPILTRLLEANLSPEKRIRALTLLQELTYGIKISWQEAHLPYLITMLSQWLIQSSEEEVITLSLSVLVNLCYKNLPAVYTLMRTVNTKTFLQFVVTTRSHNINIRVQCCKLLIILECTNSHILDQHILDVVAVTFTNIIPALRNKDALLLRHIVDFFDDIRQNVRFRNVLISYENYPKDVESILETLKSVSDPECVALIMEFLLSLMKLKLPILVQMYPECVKTAISWVAIEQVVPKALALIRTIVIDSRRTKNNSEVLAHLDLSILALIVKETDEANEKTTAEMQENYAELMQLLQEMVKTPTTRSRVQQVFTDQRMRQLMRPMLECDDGAGGDWRNSVFQDPATSFYIHALALTADLAATNSNWLTLYTELLQRKQIQAVLALALFTGDGEVKQKVLMLTSTVGFPQECVSALARSMEEIGPFVNVQGCGSTVTPAPITGTNCNAIDGVPLFSLAQEGRLDTFIQKLEKAMEENRISEISTSAVMELYEYKLAAMRHAERAMHASLEAASNHSTSLQHRLAQAVAQSSQLHQVLFQTQQCLEGSQQEKLAMSKKLIEMEEQAKKTHSVQLQEIGNLKKITMDKCNELKCMSDRIRELEHQNTEILVLQNKLKEVKGEKAALIEAHKEMLGKNNELSRLIQKMQENINKKDQIIEEKCKEITSNQKDMAAQAQELKHLVQQCHSFQNTISEKEEYIQKMYNELKDFSRMRDMIFELTAKKKDDLNSS